MADRFKGCDGNEDEDPLPEQQRDHLEATWAVVRPLLEVAVLYSKYGHHEATAILMQSLVIGIQGYMDGRR